MSKKKGAIVDVSHIFRAVWHATGGGNDAYREAVQRVHAMRKGHGYDVVAVAFDAPPYHRSSLFASYKANREANDPVMYQQIDKVMSKLKDLGFVCYKSTGYEADDIIASVVRQTEEEYEWDIHTGDKDLMQLVDDDAGVCVVSTKNGDRYDQERVFETFGVAPSQITDLLALCGDKADNIPGIPSVGAKTAARLLDAWGNIDGIYAGVGSGVDVEGISARVVDAVKKHRENVLTSLSLVRLFEDVELDLEALKVEKSSMQDIEREAIQNEPPVEEAVFEPNEDTGADEPIPYAPVEDPERGDSLVSGAVAKQSRALTVSRQESPVRAGVDQLLDAIEIRPGQYLTAPKLKLMQNVALFLEQSDMFKKLMGKEGILSVMLLGAELGIPPVAACQNFHMIEGKPSPSAHFLIALAKRHPDCVYLECIEENADRCVYATKKRTLGDRELTFSYTRQEAEEAGMFKQTRSGRPSPWQTRPREMLRKTAGSQAARLWYPDACSGLYSAEEMGYALDEEG